MTDEDGKIPDDRLEELYTWISTIPFSKPKKNLTRDFSDAVLMAEVLKVYYPRYVDLHNYVSASSLVTKKENWTILNRKVFCKIDMKLSKDTIAQLVHSQPGAAEHLLLELRDKILKNSVHQSGSCNDKEKNRIEKGRNDEDATTRENCALCLADQLDPKIVNSKRSMLGRSKNAIFFVVRWLIFLICIWNYFPRWRSRSSRKEDLAVTRVPNTHDGISEEDIAVFLHVCAHLTQELGETEDNPCTINRMIDYLESTRKLKNLQTSSGIRLPKVREKVKVEE